MKESSYVIFKEEYDHFTREYLFRRRRAIDLLKSILEEKDTDNWPLLYSYLCEYVSILYRFEEILDTIPLSSKWDQENNCWAMDEQVGVNLIHLIGAEAFCRGALNQQNLSFLLH